MTAEVAILNKLGIALAADSAVTISEGENSKKVFNTADKLFELSRTQPIACMVFSNLQFMHTPLQVLIKQFRKEIENCNTISDASEQLLVYLHNYAKLSSDDVKVDVIVSNIRVHYNILAKRASDQITRKLSDPNFFANSGNAEETFRNVINESWSTAISVLDRFSNIWSDADFIGEFPSLDGLNSLFDIVIESSETRPPDEYIENAKTLLAKILRKSSPFESSTGVVIAGYGNDEIFPTVEHYDIYAPLMGTLKYKRSERVDICRSGPRARVMAFAQREMAERFLFGLDAQTRDRIVRFCSQSLSVIGEHAIDLVQFEDDEKKALFRTEIAKAEAAFIDALQDDGMESIRLESQNSVEDMVEFMPKQDLAEFAEALVNLSSLQRRVNSGFETVGGPVDVAVISKAEGLVWVKRKHYFPEGLNSRFFDRIRSTP